VILAWIQWEQYVFFFGLSQSGLDTTNLWQFFDGFLFLSPAWGFGACHFSHKPYDMSSKNPDISGWL